MGIEPTGRKVDLRPNGFEDRGHHQVSRHFLAEGEQCNSARVYQAIVLSQYVALIAQSA